jgi:hypothetical protein
MAYSLPGNADVLDQSLVELWNEAIQEQYRRQERYHSRFFAIDPEGLESPQRTGGVKWFSNPAEPGFCADPPTVRALCDWGVAGRQRLHNEYCEYAVVRATDSQGRDRPKRVEVTTELREYWLLVAVNDPERLRSMTAEVLGVDPDWEDLYDHPDPQSLSPAEREEGFIRQLAGGEAGDPVGALNTERALFMSHPINGLDDLLYIVLFGAQPYVVGRGAERRPASRDEIFSQDEDLKVLACRHADPAAALGAQGVALQGQTVAFADPLGMYIRDDANWSLFSYEGGPVPEEWIRFSRGEPGTYQRLVVGPADDDAAFLDDIIVSVGAADEPLVGGYQLLEQIECGPQAAVGEGDAVEEDEYVELDAAEPVDCRAQGICDRVAELEAAYDEANSPAAPAVRRVGPRRVGPA